MLGSPSEEEIRRDVLGKLGAWGRNRGEGWDDGNFRDQTVEFWEGRRWRVVKVIS